MCNITLVKGTKSSNILLKNHNYLLKNYIFNTKCSSFNTTNPIYIYKNVTYSQLGYSTR